MIGCIGVDNNSVAGHLVRLDVQRLVDSMDGIVYVLDQKAHVVTVGATNWNAFATANGGAYLRDGGGVIGRSIYDFISGDLVRKAYEQCFDGLLSRRFRHAHIETRCDSPGMMRLLRLSVMPILREGRVEYLLIQSIPIVERIRPYMDLFDFAALRVKKSIYHDLPILTMCSYCQCVRYPPGSQDGEGEWTTAEEYYRRGGETDICISHGLCEPCFDKALDSLAA